MKISIVTATYNRVYILKKLYDSLINQKYMNFEWIIIDDGSTDNTNLLIDKFIKEAKIKIKYIIQENQGKHIALNNAFDLVEGELTFIVDSDDYITSNALELIVNEFDKIKKSSNLAGMAFLRGYDNSNSIGTYSKNDGLELYLQERRKNKITGDKAEVFYSDILKKNKFPSFNNEKFLSENVLWYKICDSGYKLKYINSIIYICNYLEDGLTNNIEKRLLDSPIGFKVYVKLTIKNESFINQIKIISLYYKLFQKSKKMKEIKDDLDISYFKLFLSILIRKIRKRDI